MPEKVWCLPIRNRSLEATFGFQCLLIDMDVVSVPCQKITRVVDVGGLLNMGYNEIVELFDVSQQGDKEQGMAILTRDFAPAAMLDGVLGGNFCRHRTASMYALRSGFESEPLTMISRHDI